jgi:hypothetical protein
MNYSAPVSKTIGWSRSTGTGCQAGLGVGSGECLGRDFNGRGIVWFHSFIYSFIHSVQGSLKIKLRNNCRFMHIPLWLITAIEAIQTIFTTSSPFHQLQLHLNSAGALFLLSL